MKRFRKLQGKIHDQRNCNTSEHDRTNPITAFFSSWSSTIQRGGKQKQKQMQHASIILSLGKRNTHPPVEMESFPLVSKIKDEKSDSKKKPIP